MIAARLPLGPTPPHARRARAVVRARAMTLIEILIVLVILSVVMVGVVVGSGQLGTSRLKHAATALSGGVRIGFTRATATSKSMRIVFDLDNQAMWLEEGDAPMLVQSKDVSGTGGAEAVTAAERQATAEAESIVKGPKIPKPHFRAVSGFSITSEGSNAPAPAASGEANAAPGGETAPPSGKGPAMLPRGITFREVQTAHDDTPRTSGRAYLYFWPGGLTERASIQLRIGKSVDDGDTLSLLVSPLTGKVTVKNGPVPLVVPHDEKEASEREDTGGF